MNQPITSPLNTSHAIIRYPTELPFPFAKAVAANGFLFLSGQVAMDDSGSPQYGDVPTQTRLILNNLQRTLIACGGAWEQVVKVTVWLSDMAHFAAFNQEYQRHFPAGFPARSVVSCQLAFGLDVEIELQACTHQSSPSPRSHADASAH